MKDKEALERTKISFLFISKDYKLLLKHKTYADFKIIATSEDNQATTFECHRHLLACRWPWFKRMLDSGLKEAAEGQLDFTPTQNDLGISIGFFQLLLQYFYTGETVQFDEVDLSSGTEEAPGDADGAAAAAASTTVVEAATTFYEHVIDYFGFEDTPILALQHSSLLRKWRTPATTSATTAAIQFAATETLC